MWNAGNDHHLCFKVKLKSLDTQSSTITKRIALSIVNGIFDPMGLVSPVIVQGKMLLRELTLVEPNLG